ncbi:MAG TPA: metalloregulator ArsR/SmtB family transcription factor [Anaerolineaceae bacterium]|nr:metalloregulator ArsR/SmtB family transcription factor [Anaerolineaceae bacterium]HPN50775.1 metalloregulator ArsR/SmtB family transcription factor [Anaerolineaceae bacterium]
MNISSPQPPETQLSRLLALIGQPVRIQILLILGGQEACVCHLEAVLGLRQASISQHLMALRKAGLVEPRRCGRNIFYHLVRPEVVSVLNQAAVLAGLDPAALQQLAVRPVAGCPCPQCNPNAQPGASCQNLHPAPSSSECP